MFCGQCGTQCSNDSKFCSNCGAELHQEEVAATIESPTAATPVHNPSNTNTLSLENETSLENEEELSLFVGKNTTYYFKKWKNPKKRLWGMDSNWAAFFLSTYWLAYRKLYKPAFAIWGVLVLLNVILQFVPDGSFALSRLSIILGCVAGLWGNKIYYKHAQKKIAEIKQIHQEPQVQKAEIIKAGGTSWIGVLVLILLSIILGFALTFIPSNNANTVTKPISSSSAKANNSSTSSNTNATTDNSTSSQSSNSSQTTDTGSTQPSASNNTSDNQTSQQQQTNDSSNGPAKIGDILTYTNGVSMQATGIIITNGSKTTFPPQNGNEFLFITLHMENNGASPANNLLESMFHIVDQNGNTINESNNGELSLANIPNNLEGGILTPGQKSNGFVIFEIPINEQKVTLRWNPSLTGSAFGEVSLDCKNFNPKDIDQNSIQHIQIQ